jgi:hypothetical protein
MITILICWVHFKEKKPRFSTNIYVCAVGGLMSTLSVTREWFSPPCYFFTGKLCYARSNSWQGNFPPCDFCPGGHCSTLENVSDRIGRYMEANFRRKVHFDGLYNCLRYFEFTELTAENHKFAYTAQVKITREITLTRFCNGVKTGFGFWFDILNVISY